jgi:hypothetical protein
MPARPALPMLRPRVRGSRLPGHVDIRGAIQTVHDSRHHTGHLLALAGMRR